MGQFYTKSEKKIRPGVYQRYENNGGSALVSAANGVVAAVVAADWGPLNELIPVTSDNENNTMLHGSKVVREALIGGASTVYAVRVGSGGTKGSLVLKDTTSSTAIDAVTVTMKYEGSRAFKCALRGVLGDSTQKEFAIYDDGSIVEKVTFPVSTSGEVDSFVSAASESAYFSVEKKSGYSGTGALALFTEKDIIAGTNPTVTNANYTSGLGYLERLAWNTLICDTDETAVHSVLASFANRMFEGGRMGFVVVGEPCSVEFATRATHAAAFNDFNVIYVGEGWKDAAGVSYEGCIAAARIAGMVSALDSAYSLTHGGGVIQGAVEPIEYLTNAQAEMAISSGMLVFTVSSGGSVWIESAITTLVTPSGEDDEGWKKIKRCKIRFEMMQRIGDSVDPLIGRVPNNSDGRATITTIAQGILNSMVSENKLSAGAVIEFVEAPDADSAYFSIIADDLDSLEKIYLTYKFRFVSE